MNQRTFIKLVMVGCALVALAWPFTPARVLAWQAKLRQWSLGKSATTARFVGQQVCAQCHGDIVKRYASSGMSHALTPGAAFPHLPQMFKFGDFEYRLEKQGEQLLYTIKRGQEQFSAPLLWTFGHGLTGHTFLLRHEGKFYESRVSYFTTLQGLDITPGAPAILPATLADAIGQPLNEGAALGCIRCHSTPTAGTNATTLTEFTPNIHCEACHGAGEKHVALMKTPAANKAGDKAIFHPKAFFPDDLNQRFCGACHRNWETVIAMPNRGGIANVRFQPYRLANSKCYQNPDDRRISCIACHDPHAPLSHEAAMYDTKCFACHRDSEKAAPAKTRTAPACRARQTSNCATCHMPKVEPEGLHFKFTDHWIRIEKPGTAPPL